MSTLVIYGLLTASILIAMHWLAREYCVQRNHPGFTNENIVPGGAPIWFPDQFILYLVVAFATVVQSALYFAIQLRFAHPLAGIDLDTYRNVPAILFYLGDQYAGARAVRAAIFGHLIGVAAYLWYWERRNVDLRVKKAIAALATPIGASPEPQQIANVLRSAMNRLDPPSLAMILLVFLAVATIEGPDLLRLTEWKIGKDGVSVSMREGRSERDGMRVGGVGAIGSVSDHPSTEYPILLVLDRRIEKDIDSICAFEAWKKFVEGRNLPTIDHKDISNITILGVCRDLLFKGPILPDPTAGFSSEFLKKLEEMKKYNDLSRNRSQVLLSCFAWIQRHHDRRPSLRALMAPLMESYLRLDSALRDAGVRSVDAIGASADAEMRAYLAAIAGLADAKSISSLPTYKFDDPAHKNDECVASRIFAENIKLELAALADTEKHERERGVHSRRICEPPPSLPTTERGRPNIEAICDLVVLDGKLPYGQMALAAMTYLSGESIVAALQLQRWLADFISQQKTKTGRDELIVDAWFKFIMVNTRNFILRTKFDVSDRYNLERLLMQRDISAGSLIERFAPDFGPLVKNGDKKKICGEANVKRIVLILTIMFDENHSLLDRKIKFAGQWELAQSIRRGTLHADYTKAISRSDYQDCIKAAKIFSEDVADFAMTGLKETEADYWTAVANFLDSEQGRSLAFQFSEDSAQKFRAKATKALEEALSDTVKFIRGCELAPSSARVCAFTYRKDDSETLYDEAQWFLTGTDSIYQYYSNIRSKLTDLKRMEQR